MNYVMRVLVACEWSNTVRDAFLAHGHDAYSCDLIRAEHPNPNWRRHIQGDVTPLLRERWDLVIAHPPCTYLCHSGVRWLKNNPTRYKLFLDAVDFFLECWIANAPKICIENPIMHASARSLILPGHQEIHPWQFGHPVEKTTCLWLQGLPPLRPTNIVSPESDIIHGQPGRWYSSTKSRERSRTFPGIAQAMAAQWG
jgi:hypothetical protein